MKIGSHWAMPPFDLKLQQVLAPAVLEDGDDDTVGRADREQVEHDRLRRDHDRPERDQQQAEREEQHEAEHERSRLLHRLVRVVRRGRAAGDGERRARQLADRRREDVVPQPEQRVGRDVVDAVPVERDLDPRRRAATR